MYEQKKNIYIKKKLHPPHLGKGGGMYIYVWVVVLQARKAFPFSEMETTAHPTFVPKRPTGDYHLLGRDTILAKCASQRHFDFIVGLHLPDDLRIVLRFHLEQVEKFIRFRLQGFRLNLNP